MVGREWGIAHGPRMQLTCEPWSIDANQSMTEGCTNLSPSESTVRAVRSPLHMGSQRTSKLRRSRTVLGEPGGAIPPGHSPQGLKLPASAQVPRCFAQVVIGLCKCLLCCGLFGARECEIPRTGKLPVNQRGTSHGHESRLRTAEHTCHY